MIKYDNYKYNLDRHTQYSKFNYNEQNSNFELMKKLCNKFIDVKILPRSLLDNENDFIFNNLINLQFNNKIIFNDIFSRNSKFYEYKINKDECVDINSKLTNEFIILFHDNLKNKNKDTNINANMLKFCYNLYLFSVKEEINIFSTMKVDLILDIKEKIIELIELQQFQEIPVNLRNKYNSKESILEVLIKK